jgi:hypothetical protein
MAALSLPFDRLINGQMKEAQERRAELPDVYKNDFLRLCENAYLQDYSLPPFGIEDSDNDTEASSTEVTDEDDDEERVPSRPASLSKVFYQEDFDDEERLARKNRTERMADDLQLQKMGDGIKERWRQRNYLIGGCHPPPNPRSRPFEFCPNLGFVAGPVLLAHANLYSLAGCYIIPRLQGLVLDNLRDDLEDGTPYLKAEGLAIDVIDLA